MEKVVHNNGPKGRRCKRDKGEPIDTFSDNPRKVTCTICSKKDMLIETLLQVMTVDNAKLIHTLRQVAAINGMTTKEMSVIATRALRDIGR